MTDESKIPMEWLEDDPEWKPNYTERQKLRKECLRQGRDVMAIALDVHMTNIGSYEREREEQEKDRKLIWDILNNWEPSTCDRSRRFEAAVKEVLWSAYAEKEWYKHERQ